jgi:hypothetical protein
MVVSTMIPLSQGKEKVVAEYRLFMIEGKLIT